MPKPIIIVATRNKGKLLEIQDIFADLPFIFNSLDSYPQVPEIIEDADTFEENSLKKAAVVYNTTQLPVLADDSGLEVDALNGAPGVFSARFSGGSSMDNNRLLLEKMKNIPLEKRSARFTCVAVFQSAGKKPVVSRGSIEGIIGFEEKGNGGFGYDPLFIPYGQKRTFAEWSAREKNKKSHRFKAFEKLREAMRLEIT